MTKKKKSSSTQKKSKKATSNGSGDGNASCDFNCQGCNNGGCVNLPDLTKDSKEIIEASREFVLENEKGVIVGKYSSPRISSEISDCSMPMTFDSYNYCSLGCLYCFAYFFKSNNPAIKNIELKAVDVDAMINAMKGKPTTKMGETYYRHFYSKKFLLHWGGMADPFCAFEKNHKVGFKLLHHLGETDYPTLLSFKGSTIFGKKYVKLFEEYASQNNFAFQVSIITNDDELSKQIEIGVPPTSKRLEALRMLSDMGYYTVLRLRPFIMGISDKGLEELLQRALEAGIKGVSMEFFALDARCNAGMKTRYDWIAKLIGVDNLMKYFKETSPPERGGYMRTNRLLKEPYVRTVYEFCMEHNLNCGISDPDFKELNTSGSCCGMPDMFERNEGMTNWTTSQLTYHLKQARIKYHKTGNLAVLRFREVYGNESYLDDKYLANDHVSVIGRNCAERVNLTQRDILQEQWNNLRSPACPRNYLHGKVLPTGLDAEGNLEYTYAPSEYERRWQADGIKLSEGIVLDEG
jgi:DNA repair photolyase